jgi:hypothetical protein
MYQTSVSGSRLIIFLLTLCSLSAFAAIERAPTRITAVNLLSHQVQSFDFFKSPKKASVLVFMSAKCPCSNSHVPLLRQLAQQYKDMNFIAVHSNSDENVKEAEVYFKKNQLGFPVLQDAHNRIADRLQAYKTPHVFVFSPEGRVLYQGGVTNSTNAAAADRFFLKDALNDIENNRAVKVTEGRTLGCVILRESEVR